MKARIIVCLMALAISNAALAQSQFRTIEQPNGTTFQAVERGDEFFRFYETPEGYVVRKGADGFYRYYDIDENGDFVEIDLKVGIDAAQDVRIRPYQNPKVKRALSQKIEAFNAAADANRMRYLAWQRAALGQSGNSGKNSRHTLSSQTGLTLEVGVLLVEFNNVQHHGGANGYSIVDFETMLFSDNSYITLPPGDPNGFPLSPDNEVVFGSLRDYFEFQSHGCLTVTGQVINPNTGGVPTWLNMGNSATYAPGGYFDIQDLVPDAINAAIGQGWTVNLTAPFMTIIVIAQDERAPNVGFEWGYAYFQSHPYFWL